MHARSGVLSIGHSTLSYEQFVVRLKAHGVTAIADVRTTPFSRTHPHFAKDALKPALVNDQIAYAFLGRELGGRPRSSKFFTEGVADYEKMAMATEFNSGVDRLIEGARKYRIALMCSERNPLDCHRCLLVGRALAARRIIVQHIVSDSLVIDQREIEEHLLALANKTNADMFASPVDRLNDAYRERAKKVAFSASQATSRDEMRQRESHG